MNMPGQRPRTDRRARDRRADNKALPRQHSAQRFHQRGLATEQMGAAGDIEQQTMRRIEGHQRREAVAPVGDAVQGSCIRHLVGIEHLEIGTDRARIGEWLADREADPRSRIVQRGDDQALLCLATTMRGWSSVDRTHLRLG